MPTELPTDLIELAQLYYREHTGYCLIIAIAFIRLTQRIFDEKFFIVLCEFMIKIGHSNQFLIHQKQLKISNATNKTIS